MKENTNNKFIGGEEDRNSGSSKNTTPNSK